MFDAFLFSWAFEIVVSARHSMSCAGEGTACSASDPWTPKWPVEDVSHELEEPKLKRVRMPNFTAEEDLGILSTCSIAEKQPPASIFAGALKDRTPAQCLQRWKNIKRIQLKNC